MLVRGSADERYATAIAKASKLLRNQLRDNRLYEVANTWAVKLCRFAQQTHLWNDPHEISQQERQYLREWKSEADAARSLARHLDVGDWCGTRVDEAARRAGVVLIPDSKEAEDNPFQYKILCRQAFTNMLRELEKQPVRSHQRRGSSGTPLLCGPLLVIPPGKRLRLPKKPMSLAIALIYGFRKLTGAVERNPASAAGRKPASTTDECFGGLYFNNNVYRRFDLLSGGKPCHEAATLFANLTFNTALEASAVTDWLKRNKRRVYVLMEDTKDI